jgi:hypothetical protein
MVLAPILPAFAVLNATRKILNVISTGLARSANVAGSTRPSDVTGAIAGSAWSADVGGSITRSARSADIGGPIARCARSTNIGGTITRCARSADVGGPITRLSGTTDISGSITRLPWAAKIGPPTARSRGQRRRDVTGSWTASGTRELARAIAEKLGGSAACKRAAGTCNCTSAKS